MLWKSTPLAALLIITACLSQAWAQTPPVEYTIHWIPFASDDNQSLNDFGDGGLVVGWNNAGSSGQEGFVYNQITGFKTLTSLGIVPAEPGWVSSSCVGVNGVEEIVGYFHYPDGSRFGFYADLAAPAAWVELPTPPGSDYAYGRKINNNGDVLAYFRDAFGGWGYLINPNNSLTNYEILMNPITGTALEMSGGSINDTRQVAGYIPLEDGALPFRLTPGEGIELLGELEGARAISDDGTVAGRVEVQVRTGKGKNTVTQRFPVRYTNQVEPITLEVTGTAEDINKTGDVVGSLGRGPDRGTGFVFHADVLAEDGTVIPGHGLLNLDDLVVLADADEEEYWMSASSILARKINCRDGTGFGQILGTASSSETIGKGKNRVTITDHGAFILTPRHPLGAE